MDGRGRRGKGARGELEFFHRLNEHLPEPLHMQRELSQTRDGGSDGNNPAVAIEVKRQERLNLPRWLRQAESQAQPDQIPVLAYRQNRGEWEILMCLTVEDLAELIQYLSSNDRQNGDKHGRGNGLGPSAAQTLG